jgi:hypothetical protein
MQPSFLYFIAFIIIVGGLLLYNINNEPKFDRRQQLQNDAFLLSSESQILTNPETVEIKNNDIQSKATWSLFYNK